MSYDNPGTGALAYDPCRYGTSRLTFRGPQRGLDRPYCAVIGGSETYGKFVPRPFTALVEEATGLPMLNLGCVNAGIDVFLNDAAVMDLAAGARVTVVQTLGAHNLSNRFYVVHPRRNDRFVRASAMLRALYPGIDFTEFHFTRHLLGALHRTSPAAFELVVAELQMAWQARMRSLAMRVPGDKVLLWLSTGEARRNDGLGDDPLFVTRPMVDSIRPHFARVIEVQPSADALTRGTEGMVHSDLEAPAASALPGPAVHEEVAEAMIPHLRDLTA